MDHIVAVFASIVFSLGAFFGWHKPMTLSDLPVIPPAPQEMKIQEVVEPAVNAAGTVDIAQKTQTNETSSSGTAVETKQVTIAGLSQTELLALASNAFADGNVPVGDSKYVTDAPKKGYVYLCNVRKDNPGSMVNGPWMKGTTWNYLQKIAIDGSVSWPNAKFSVSISGASRIVSGNDLPINHTTGTFPVQSSDDASQYDKNPNTISAQTLNQKFPAEPVYSETPNCMGGEVGIMLSGVVLFNAFDAGLRDAPAHELQDSCDGHPQGSGQYHYHSISACFKDINVSTVLGYALDGFPITGPQVASGKYLTTDDLDICHGITSEVLIDGKKKMTYHYVMTRDFPYSVSCFRAKPVSMMVIQGAGPQQGQMQGQGSGGQPPQGMPPPSMQSMLSGGGQGMQPPQEAINACNGKSQGSSCSFSTPMGTISGHCDTPPNSSLACVPQ